ncbi:valine--tRNA ligase [Halorarius litoreus]|uniref:valine--tRNA ligase n=1 Tax=Halorarius litoreus TaxID=2962676 RepID=UPI0020CF08C5|nr:valine--tRNA ligase [Halorarius litoreus]
MSDTPDSYDPAEAEPRWREAWAASDLHRYDGDDSRPDYVIDTPPPYPTGNMHIGNALGWCYMDFLARYKRLQGHDVLFPQGWDCHGLPTEVKVEENHGIHRTEVSRDEFRDLCIQHTEEQIEAMKETMGLLGFSQDWAHEFRTMDPDYWGETQRSFVRMTDDDRVYRDEHPVNWCPRCETAIADAEVETVEREGTLYTITFTGVDSEDIDIATTRPELLAACVAVAVDPEGDFADRAGETVEVPIFGQQVGIIADEDVDESFGTGAVMVCTFGDKQDVTWWQRHDLDLRAVLTEDGHLTDAAGDFAGLGIDEAKDEIATALTKSGHLHDESPTDQQVGTCWRCDTPIEILSKEQWFVTVDTDEVLARAQDVEWVPEHMYGRLEEWAEGMEWDWVISRQRVFATPIPAWFCESCGHVHVAEEADLPVDPTDESPTVDCPKCSADAWRGETDVMDTWMDSSISPLFVRGWPDAAFEPVHLREQGHDIIRTWAFYTLLRTAALEDEKPWETALVNGMVFGEDGHKMSKSRDNFVQPEEVVEEHGADAFRQALALAGQPGTDVQFQPKEVTSASRFQNKLWNVTNFATSHLDERTPDIEAPAYRDADAWILARAGETADAVAEHMAHYRFDSALRTVREFVWGDLADDYLELVKGRLYEGRPGERNAARHALFRALRMSLTMLAPFAPFVAEEAYDQLPVEGSVHAGAWPERPDVDAAAVDRGALVADVAAEIRGWKSEAGIALNADLPRVELYLDDEYEGPNPDTYDLANAINAPVYIETGRPSLELVPVAVEPDHSVVGPEFRDRAGAVVSALDAMDPAEVRAAIDTHGEVRLDLDGDEVAVSADAVTVREELRAESGEEVAVLEPEGATVIVYPAADD